MLLSKLLNRFRSDEDGVPSVPADTRLYAIGDIHGRDDLLAALLVAVERDGHDYPDKRKVLIFLGDYIDRGLQSRQVLDRLTGPMPEGFEAVFLKGNHELAMQQFMRDPQFGRTWKYYGGLETMHSYGITELTLSDDPMEFERARDRLRDTLPVAHKQFLDGLVSSVEFGDYFFAHAGVRPGIPLRRQIEDDLLWIREDFLESRASFGKIVVHGHSPSEEAVFRPNRIGIDTGAYMTGVLTCLVLDGQDRQLLQTGEQPVLAAVN